MTTPDDQAASAVVDALNACETYLNCAQDGTPCQLCTEDAAHVILTALRKLGWAPAHDTAERIARAIETAAGPGAGLDSFGTGMLRAARIAREHGQPRGRP